MLLHMLRWMLGDDDFFAALRSYINDPELSFKSALTPDLQWHLENTSGLDLDGFFRDWYENQGYPSYHIRWAAVQGGISMTVEQTTSHQSVDFFAMPLPVKISGEGVYTIVRLDHQFSGQEFVLDLPFTPEEVVFDPDLWLISAGNTVENVVTGISDLSEEDVMIRIYPNPADQVLNIRATDERAMDGFIVVYNATGQQVYQRRLSAKVEEVNIESWPSGMYFISLTGVEGVIYTTRAIKL